MKILLVFFGLIACSVSNSLHCQVDCRLPLGGKLKIGLDELDTRYKIISPRDSFVITGRELRDHSFNFPGSYEVRRIGSLAINSCGHEQKKTNYMVIVDSVTIDYVPNSIRFSSPIISNRPTDTQSFVLEVNVRNYYNTPVQLNRTPSKFAGIGCDIIAFIDEKTQTIPTGRQLIRYKMEGICIEKSYIQIDLRPYYFTIPIGITEPVK